MAEGEQMDPVVVQRLGEALTELERVATEHDVALVAVVAAVGADGELEVGRSIPEDETVTVQMVATLIETMKPPAPVG